MFKNLSENRNDAQNQELLLFSALGLFAFAASAPYLLDKAYIADNCAMYLDCARLILEGKAPYKDFVDLNPPFVMYASMIPVLASQFLHISCVTVFKISVLLLSLASSLGSAYFLLAGKKHRNFVPVIIFVLLFAGVFLKFQYGERDHLFMLCYLPFFFLRIYRNQNSDRSILRWPAILAGALAGVGVCFKPICLIVPVVAECFYAGTKKRNFKDAEIVSFLIVLLLYLLSFLALPMQALKEYFGFLAPLTLSEYSVFNIPSDMALSLFCYNGAVIKNIFLFFLTILTSFALRKTCTLIPPLLGIALSGYLLCAAQAKGWGYHQCIPYYGMLFLLFLNTRVLFSLFHRCWKNMPINLERKKQISQPLVSLLAFLFLSLPITFMAVQDSGKSGFALDDIRERLHADTKSGDSLVVISSSVSPAYPALLEEKRINGSKYLWAVPLVMLDHARDKGKEEKRIFDTIWSDIETKKPKLVFIETTLVTWTCPSTLLQMAQRQGLIKNLEKKYEQLERSDRFLTYRLKPGETL